MLRNLLAVFSNNNIHREKAEPSSPDLLRVNILRAKENCINSSLNKPLRQEDSIILEDTTKVREKNYRELSGSSKKL